MRPKLERPQRPSQRHLRPKRPKRSRRLRRRFKRRMEGAGLNNQHRSKTLERLRTVRSAKVEPSYFKQYPNVTSGVASHRPSFKERRYACAFVRNDYIGCHVSLSEYMTSDLLKRSVLVGSYYLLTDGYVPVDLCREIVSLCFRFWSSVITRSGKPLWKLSKFPPTWLLKPSRPSKMSNFERGLVKELHEVEPRKAHKLLASLSADARDFESAYRNSNPFEILQGSGEEWEGSEYGSFSEGESYDEFEIRGMQL